MAKVKPIPAGYHSLTPHLIVKDAAKAIEFYQQAFGAEVLGIHRTPDGQSIMHAEMKIGDSPFMLNDEYPQFGVLSPLARGGSSVTLHLYVEDVDAAFDRAVKAGATVKMPVADMFWGDRFGQVSDPFGHSWSIATHTKDLTEAEVIEGAKKAFAEMPNSCGENSSAAAE